MNTIYQNIFNTHISCEGKILHDKLCLLRFRFSVHVQVIYVARVSDLAKGLAFIYSGHFYSLFRCEYMESKQRKSFTGMSLSLMNVLHV